MNPIWEASNRMISGNPRKIKQHKNRLATVRASRTPKRVDTEPYLSTPPLSDSSAETPESESISQYLNNLSPTIAADYPLPSGSFPPMATSENRLDFNPFLLPPAAYPAFGLHQPMEPQAFGGYPTMLGHKPKAPSSKRATSRVVFSDEASIISDDRGEDETASDTDLTETERRTRPNRKPTAVEKPRRREPTKIRDGNLNRPRSAPPPSSSKAVQLRKVGSDEEPKPTRNRSSSSRTGEQEEGDVNAGGDDLMSRISSAIPDLHLLLSRYKETNGELGIKDQIRKRIEAQQLEMMKTKEEIIQSLMTQLEDAAKDHADETSELRSNLNALEVKQLEFSAQMAIAEKRIKTAESRMKSAEEGEKRVTRQNELYIIERSSFAKRAAEETERALINQRNHMLEGFEREKAALKVELEKERKDFESSIPKQKEELEAGHQKEKEELESGLKKENGELQTKIDDLEKQLGELGTTDSEVREKLEKEFSEKEATLTKKHEEDIETLKEHHKEDINEQTRGFVSLQERLNKHLIEEIDTLKTLLTGVHLDPIPPAPSVEAAPDG
jgi:hypothetical protein